MTWCQRVEILCLLVCASFSSCLSTLDYGVVYAKNGMFRFVGDTLDLYCNITNKDIRENSSMLHIERITKKGRNVIPPDYIDILSTRAIQLTIWKVSLYDDGIYTCFQETFSGESRVIGSETIKVDYKPKKIREISCRVYNWEQMKCTWDLGEDFQHPEYINVSLAWTIHGEQHDCPELTQTSCLWDSDVYTHGPQYWMVVEVRTVVDGKELFKEKSPPFRIDTVLYVEPAPVSNLQATVENSTCVYLSWHHHSVDWQKFFVAECKIRSEEKWHQVILNQEQEKKEYQSPVCGLIPFTDYEFRMSVLPFPVETTEPVIQGYRSEWSFVTAKTLEDVPGAAPKICSSCFYDFKCPHSHSGHCVRIYWQSLTDKEKHGILISYNITYINVETLAAETLILPVTETELQHSVDLRLPASRHSFRISIKPGTSQGFSRSLANILLPSTQKKPNPPKSFLVETDKDEEDDDIDDESNVKFYLSWAALNIDSKTGLKYTHVSVLWCCGQSQEAECQSDIHWVKLPADQVTYELQPQVEGCHRDDFLIGIAAEVFHNEQVISSGIHWSSCIYLRNQKPLNSPKNIRQSSIHPVNGLTVMWDIFECKEERSFITEYLVRYCPLYEDNSCMEGEKSLNVSNNVGEVTLDHLKEDVRYKVVVIAVSSAGLGPSDPLVTQAVKGSPMPESLVDRSVGISIGIFSFVILLGLIIVLWRFCIHKRRKAQNGEDLIQPYAQSSESTRGSDKTKGSRHSESCSEESVTSQTNLLSSLILTNQTPPMNRTDNNTNMRKFAAYKISKEKTSLSEMKMLLNHQPPLNRNVSACVSHGGSVLYPRNESAVKRDSLALNHLNNKHIHATVMPEPNWSSISDTSCSRGKVQSCAGCLHQQSAVRDLDDSFNQSEITCPSKMNLNETCTLLLRRHGVESPVCTASDTELQAANSFPVSKHKNCGNVFNIHHRAPNNNYIPKNPAYVRSYQPLPQQSHSVKETDKVLQTHIDPYRPKCQCECMTSEKMADSQTPVDKINNAPENNNTKHFSRVLNTPKSCKRCSVPLQSVLHFPPLPTSPPPSPCPEDTHFTTSISSLPPCTSSELSVGSQCPPLMKRTLVSEPQAIRTSLTVVNNYSPHEIFLEAVIDHSAPTACSASPDRVRASYSSLSLNISPSSSPAIYVEYLPQADGQGGEGKTKRVENVHQPVISAHTFPRNSSKDTVTLSLPSPLTRPLSGDLLELPPEYYEDPILKGSNPILTEL